MRIKQILVSFFVFAVIGLLGFIAYYFYRSNKLNQELLSIKQKELMKANLALGRAETKLTKQEQVHRAALARINKKWKAEIKKRQALVSLLAEMKGKYEAEKKKIKIKTKVVYKDKPGRIDLPKGKVFLRNKDGSYSEITAMEFSYSDFRVTINGDAIKQKLSYKLHQRFEGQFVETKLPNGSVNHYFELFELDDKNTRVGKLKLTKFKVLKSNELEPRMFWWNPKIDLAINIGLNHRAEFVWGADVGISFSAYGRTINDLSWRFFRIAAGFIKQDITLSFSPASYNIARHFPLISNTWLSPFLGYGFKNKTINLGLGIGVVF